MKFRGHLYLLFLVPKNWLSRAVGWAVRRTWPLGLHRWIRDGFVRKYGVDVSEAEKPLREYPTLGALFVRRLKPEARPLESSALVCPVDGMLTERGFLHGPETSLTQIKGITYSLSDLLGPGWDASPYVGGSFLTLYLAPWNYHRIHAPATGQVLRARHMAGALWPVNAWSVNRIPGLFVRNDRILVEMQCGQGRLIVALIGATNVGRITLSFCSDLVGNAPGGQRDWRPTSPMVLDKGSDLGCFEMGSTVVLVLDAHWTARLRPESLTGKPMPVRMGSGFGD